MSKRRTSEFNEVIEIIRIEKVIRARKIVEKINAADTLTVYLWFIYKFVRI
jgi:hypothetical protein